MAYSAIAGNIAFADEKKPFIASVQARAAFEKYLEYDEGNRHFKVFVLGRSGGYAWAARSSYEDAFKWADNGCAQSVSDFSCKLYAIGDTIVVSMKKADVEEVISMYVSRRGQSGNPYPTLLDHPRIAQGFKEYIATNDAGRAKVFVKDPEGAWSHRVEGTLEEAIEEALQECRSHSELPGAWGCRLFAIGDVVVWDMSESERVDVAGAYKARLSTQKQNPKTPNVETSSSKSITLHKGPDVRVNSIYQSAAEHCQQYGKKSVLVETMYPRYTFECK